MRPVILYRDDGVWEDEEADAAEQAGFLITPSRMDIQSGDLVIGRYSVLPYYREQERDILSVGAGLINTYHHHRFVADIGAWYPALDGLTPRTWLRVSDVPVNHPGSFVLKGETNSRKFLWNTHMFAKSRIDIPAVMSRLIDDSLIGQQDIYVREFVPFEKLATGINGLPITTEFRFFVGMSQILSGGYYWASHTEELEEAGISIPDPSIVPVNFLADVTTRIGTSIPFYALDVARDESGRWWVVELNDGQMSGLSMNEPLELYTNLMEALR